MILAVGLLKTPDRTIFKVKNQGKKIIKWNLSNMNAESL